MAARLALLCAPLPQQREPMQAPPAAGSVAFDLLALLGLPVYNG
jgi:hypothetical protein